VAEKAERNRKASAMMRLALTAGALACGAAPTEVALLGDAGQYRIIRLVATFAGPVHWTPLYFPMQKVPKIKFRMSSAVVAPVISSRGRRAP